MKGLRRLSRLASPSASIEQGPDLVRSTVADDARLTPPAVWEPRADYGRKRVTSSWESGQETDELAGTAPVPDCSFARSGHARSGTGHVFPLCTPTPPCSIRLTGTACNCQPRGWRGISCARCFRKSEDQECRVPKFRDVRSYKKPLPGVPRRQPA